MNKRVYQVEELEVEVAPCDPLWPTLFATDADAVRQALGDLATTIEHFGSTTVPGLAAKPIVDSLLGWGRAARPSGEDLERLTTLGYDYLGRTVAVPAAIFSASAGRRTST